MSRSCDNGLIFSKIFIYEYVFQFNIETDSTNAIKIKACIQLCRSSSATPRTLGPTCHKQASWPEQGAEMPASTPRPLSPTKLLCIKILLLCIRNSDKLFSCTPRRLSTHVRDQPLSSQSFVMQPQHEPQIGYSDFACSPSGVHDSSADNRLSALVGSHFVLHVQAVEEWQDC